MALDIVIRNEEEAWSWFQRALNDDPELDQPVNIRFDGWPTLDLRFKGHDFESSVPTRIMPPLLDAQKEIHRLYCQLRYGEQNLRRLKNDERERLELVVRVDKGSSDYSTNLQEVLTESAKAAIANMNSIHILIAVLGISLVWGSVISWKAWLGHRAKLKGIDSRVQMSALEKEKLELLTNAYNRNPAIKELSEGVDEFRNDSLHKLKPADNFTLPKSDFEVDGRYAAEVTHKPREESIEVRLDGEFTIQAVVSGDTQGFRVKVRRVLDGKTVTVSIPDGTLKFSEIEILKNSEWAKRPVSMQINARMLRDQITSATLVSASEIEKEST